MCEQPAERRVKPICNVICGWRMRAKNTNLVLHTGTQRRLLRRDQSPPLAPPLRDSNCPPGPPASLTEPGPASASLPPPRTKLCLFERGSEELRSCSRAGRRVVAFIILPHGRCRGQSSPAIEARTVTSTKLKLAWDGSSRLF